MFDKEDIEAVTAKLFDRCYGGISIDVDMIPEKYLPKWYKKGMVSFDDEQDKEIYELCERFEEAVQKEWDRLLNEDSEEDDYQQYLDEQRNEYYTKLFSLEKI